MILSELITSCSPSLGEYWPENDRSLIVIVITVLLVPSLFHISLDSDLLIKQTIWVIGNINNFSGIWFMNLTILASGSYSTTYI
jgi:hypothetical protein